MRLPPQPDREDGRAGGHTPQASPVRARRVEYEGGGAHHHRHDSKHDLAEGPVFGHILRLAVPGAITNLLNFSYHFVDMLWLGRIGPSAIAVVATYHYFFMVIVFFNQIIGLGSMTLIARTFGAKDHEDCRRVIGQTFSFKLVIALVVMALGLIFQRWAWTAFGSAPEVVEEGVKYTTIMFSVIPIYFSAFTLRTAFTAIGDMKTLLKISAISTAVNVIADPLLIFKDIYIGPFPWLGLDDAVRIMPGAGLGVAGAAWASFASIFVLFALGQYYFMSGRTFIRVTPRHFFSWNWATVWRVLRIGTPPAVGENLTHIAQIVVGRILNLYGTAVFAAHGVVMTLFGLVFIPVGGVSQAVMAMVGQNLGAGKPERAERSVYSAVGLTAGTLVVMLVLMYFGAEGLVRFFIPGSGQASQETVMWAVRFLHIALLMMLFMGLSMVFGAAFWGSGDTKPPMYVMLATTYGIQLPVILAGALWLKLESPLFIIWAMAVSMTVNAVATVLIFMRGRWKSVEV